MNRTTGFLLAGCVGLLWLVSGCGNRAPAPVAPSLDESAQQKVKAMEALADAMAKGANSPDAQAALEQFRVLPLDADKNAEQAKQIADIYRGRIQGKYQGSVANELKGDMAPFLKK